MPDDIFSSIALTQVPHVGNIIAKNLISYCGSATAVFKTPKSRLLKIPGIGESVAESISKFKDFKVVENELKFVEKHKVKIITYQDPDYPFRLKHIADAPLVLFAYGATEYNVARVLGIVGTRNASAYGREWCEKFVSELHDKNCLIVSGLAAGIDTVAHRAALKADLHTVGVMGNGLRSIYPAQNKNLAAAMIDKGSSIITEYFSDTIPDKSNFPERNRIVAGMCDAIVVVETKKKGGSMITAGLAFQYDRDVFALPGKITDEYAEGCHYLIKTHKAALIESASDLFTQMNWEHEQGKKQPVQQQLFIALSPEERRIFDFLKEKGKTGIDDLCFELNFAQHQATMHLLEMEMKDTIKSLPGKYYEIK